MSTPLNFDARNIEPNQAMEPLPAAWYTMQITASEMKPTTSGGSYLELELTVVNGPYVGRKVFERLNLVNSNPTAVEIANKDLSAICHATGALVIQTAEQLHNIPLDVKVKVNKGDEQYEPSNEIKGYAKAGTKAQAQAATQQAAPAPMGGMPAAAPVAAPAAMPAAMPAAPAQQAATPAPMPGNPVQTADSPVAAQAAPAPAAQPAQPAPVAEQPAVVHQEAAPAPAPEVAPQPAAQTAQPGAAPWAGAPQA